MLASPNSNLYGQLLEINLRVGSSFPDMKLDDKLKFERSVLFFVPNAVIAKINVPLLIAFHGSSENGSLFRSRTTGYAYDKLACAERFVVAYPTGYKGNWNDSRRAVKYPAKHFNVDDVGFTRKIIEFASKHWATSPSKTLVAGYCNGGHMCYRLALEMGSSIISGVAIHCANLPTWDNSDCDPLEGDAIPICILNGTADPVNPWTGGVMSLEHGGEGAGGRGSHQSAIETAEYFAKRYLNQGVELQEQELEDDEDKADLHQFRSTADGRLRVQLVAMIGEGHYVPVEAGEKKALVIGPRRGAVHAPRFAINFFKEATRVFEEKHSSRHRTDSDFSDASL